MADAGNDKRARLEGLRRAYRAELPQRLAAIDACWHSACSSADAATHFNVLVRHMHSLAGSAGTFGLAELGQTARALELALGTACVDDVIGHAEQRALVDDGLARLRELSRQQELPAAAAQTMPLAPAPQVDAPHEASLVYVIEDDLALAAELAAQLGALGWQVKTFADAGAARHALLDSVPAVVIVDAVLPEGTNAGIELIGRLQADNASHIAHVVVSSRWDWASRLAAARSGADGYFVKPIDFTALAERLDKLTHRRHEHPFRVLVVDDTVLLAEHYRQVLEAAGMQARALNQPSRLLETLNDFNPELILMDLYMPECTGIEAARVVRQDAKFTGVPIVFLSTETGRQQQLAAMQTGADDFLQKPIDDVDLVSAVTVRAERFRAVAALMRQDGLTGLLNHVAIGQQLEAEVSRAQRSGAPLAVAMLDVDHFKRVNDTHGHPAGDRVIRGLAQLLRKRLRKSDIVGRYGGEEFVVVLPETSLASAVHLIDKLRAQFGLLRFIAEGQEFCCSFSAGVASMTQQCSASWLIEVADGALYEAKHHGRNRVCVAPEPKAAAPERG